jgi:hypothetical protein
MHRLEPLGRNKRREKKEAVVVVGFKDLGAFHSHIVTVVVVAGESP